MWKNKYHIEFSLIVFLLTIWKIKLSIKFSSKVAKQVPHRIFSHSFSSYHKNKYQIKLLNIKINLRRMFMTASCNCCSCLLLLLASAAGRHRHLPDVTYLRCWPLPLIAAALTATLAADCREAFWELTNITRKQVSSKRMAPKNLKLWQKLVVELSFGFGGKPAKNTLSSFKLIYNCISEAVT